MKSCGDLSTALLRAAVSRLTFSVAQRYTSDMPRGTEDVRRPAKNFGAAELFGFAVPALMPSELQRLSMTPNRSQPCPFKSKRVACHKKGGVCSLGQYVRNASGDVCIVGTPVTTCPSRFLEGGLVFSWVGETLLGTRHPTVVAEVSFLMSESCKEPDAQHEVGRIDNVLVHFEKTQLVWCALEMQAVYFSGAKFEHDLAIMRQWSGPGIPMPPRQRYPDFRSSGPKRLMPQLQTKVPTLRRWGKKMAVVVDRAFWQAQGDMRRASSLSNADIIWFVVDFEGPVGERYVLKPHDVVFTTLENAVEGLTGGTAVSLEQFEHAIRQKLARLEAS